jgi:F-type H+-transporting ATPase subunit delta
MPNERLARRYASAIFSLAQSENAVDHIGNELRDVVAFFDGNNELNEFYRSPVVERATKIAALTAAFEHKVHTITLHTILLLAQKRRAAILGEISVVYDSLVRTARDHEALIITSARPLGSHELESLVGRLSSIYKQTFDVRQELDPRLIGGLRIRMGDRSLDGSVAGKIEKLAATLFSNS